MRILTGSAALLLFGMSPPPPREVVVTGTDYAFQLPATLPAGRTVFRFVNKGKHRHELNISLLKPGVSAKALIDAANAGKPAGELRDSPVGVLFADPGKRSESGLSTDLLPGRTYVVICIFRDSDNAPRHSEMGMYATIEVPRAAPPPQPAERVDTIVGNDYAFTRYPRTLTPGRHSIAFVNAGKVRHEMSMFLMKKGVTFAQINKLEQTGGDPATLIDADFGLLHSPAGKAPVGRLEIDFLPGRDYGIVCFFQDDEKSKPHVMLGMFGTIRVNPR
jgi:hypothetical protein